MGIRNYFKNRAEDASRGTLVVSKNSWHGRLYHFWRNNSEFKNSSSYRENLCHYMRVILFWGPISVFIRWHPKKLSEWVTPLTTTLALTFLGLAGWSFFNHPWDSLITLLGIIGIFTTIFLVMCGIWLIDDNKDEISYWYHYGGRGSWIIRGPVAAFKAIGRGLIYKIGDKIPVYAVLLFALWATVSILDHDIFFLSLAAAGIILLLVGLFVGWVELLDFFKKRYIHLGRKSVEAKDESFLSVSGRFMAAKKGRICPFIEVVN